VDEVRRQFRRGPVLFERRARIVEPGDDTELLGERALRAHRSYIFPTHVKRFVYVRR